jgi:Domain of unknown function (DUF4386)
MTKAITDITLSKSARIAGIGYVIIFVLGIVANFFIFDGLIVKGDAATTANNILNNELLFRVGIASWLIVLICDIVIAWALYIFLKPISKSLSLLTAWFRLIYIAIFGITQLNLIFVLILLSGADYLAVFNASQLQALALMFLNGHNYGFLIGLVFFGVHLSLISYLILKSEYIPKILGILLILSASGYLLDSFANFLLPSYADYQTIFLLLVAVPGIIGELSFTLWLLIKGTKVQSIVTA